MALKPQPIKGGLPTKQMSPPPPPRVVPPTKTPGGAMTPPSNPIAPAPPQQGNAANPSKGGMSWDQVENTWIQGGGNAQAASMAAAVADAESALNPNATITNPDGTQSVGLWLIPKNGTPPGSTDPVANARAAVQMSSNGTDWSQWCTTWSDNNCGLNGGTYLGDGANALGALASQSGSYGVPGASPSGTGTGASATTANTTPASTGSSHSILYVIAILAVVVVVFMMVRRKSGTPGEAEESTARQQSSWSPAEESEILNSGKSGRQLSQELGRSQRAIEVRRNQLKGQ